MASNSNDSPKNNQENDLLPCRHTGDTNALDRPFTALEFAERLTAPMLELVNDLAHAGVIGAVNDNGECHFSEAEIDGFVNSWAEAVLCR